MKYIIEVLIEAENEENAVDMFWENSKRKAEQDFMIVAVRPKKIQEMITNYPLTDDYIKVWEKILQWRKKND